jgi:hypothetical protein
VTIHQSSITEHAIDAGGTDGDDIGIEHHEGQPPIALKEMLGVEGEDRPLLPVFEPPVTRDQRVVFVDQAVAIPPIVELALGNPQPGDEPMDGDVGPT